MNNVIHVDFTPKPRDHVHPTVLPRANDVSPYLLKPLRSYQQAAQDYNLKRMKEVLSIIRQMGIKS